MSDNKNCKTCQIAWDEKACKETVECPLKKYKEILGYQIVKNITKSISCSAWVQVKCTKCGVELLPGSQICNYISRPYCVECWSEERDLDDQT